MKLKRKEINDKKREKSAEILLKNNEKREEQINQLIQRINKKHEENFKK